jgi:putative acetyltransferase
MPSPDAGGWRIVRDDLTHPDVVALIEFHLRAAHENSPEGSVFALDIGGLRTPAVTVWSAWDGESLVGLGALNDLGDGEGELKSMRTAPTHLRRGVARSMLDHLIAEARRRGYRRVSLETGNNAPFAAARSLYATAGFVECGPFGGYSDTHFATYYTLAL